VTVDATLDVTNYYNGPPIKPALADIDGDGVSGLGLHRLFRNARVARVGFPPLFSAHQPQLLLSWIVMIMVGTVVTLTTTMATVMVMIVMMTTDFLTR
jgi:hypothetical protein